MPQPNAPRGEHERLQLDALLLSIDTMYGNSEFSLLGDVHAVAQRRFGFTGTLEQAFELLRVASQVRLEMAPDLNYVAVYST